MTTNAHTAAGPRTARRANLAGVLAHLRTAPASRAELAAATGLTKATVSSVVAELDAAGYVHDGDRVSGRHGRPSTTVELDATRLATLGAELRPDGIAVRALTPDGSVVHTTETHAVLSGRRPGHSLRRVTAELDAARSALTARGYRVEGIGVAVPGLVDADGNVRLAPNLGWHDVAVRQQLGTSLRTDVTVANEANLAAVAEAWCGGATDLTDFVHISAGAGVGAGVVLGGQPFVGHHGFGGEFGHFRVVHRADARTCACGGRGCLETVIGDAALAEPITAWRNGSTAAARQITAAAHILAGAVAALVNLLDPEAVLLGGNLAATADLVIPVLNAELDAQVLCARWASWKIAASPLGPDAAALGAAAIVMQQRFNDPVPVAAT